MFEDDRILVSLPDGKVPANECLCDSLSEAVFGLNRPIFVPVIRLGRVIEPSRCIAASPQVRFNGAQEEGDDWRNEATSGQKKRSWRFSEVSERILPVRAPPPPERRARWRCRHTARAADRWPWWSRTVDSG